MVRVSTVVFVAALLSGCAAFCPDPQAERTPVSGPATAALNDSVVSTPIDEPEESVESAARATYVPKGLKNRSGFKMNAIKKGGIYDQLGLREGDIIHEVNGKPLTKASDLAVLIGAVKVADKQDLKIGINRGRKNLYLSSKIITE